MNKLSPGVTMNSYNVVVEKDADTDLYVGHVPGWPAAHSQGETLDELQKNVQEAWPCSWKMATRSSSPSL